MSELTDRIAATQLQHFPEYIGGTCLCGREIANATDWAAHVAEVVVAELNLTEEWSIRFVQGRDSSRCVYATKPEGWRDTNEHLERRWVSGWVAVENNQPRDGKCPPTAPHTDSDGWSVYGRPE
jgi:hypothetical protein